MNSAIINLIEIGVASTRRLENVLNREHNLSLAQFRIMRDVARHNSLTPSQLAALLLQETHSVSGLLNRLEDRELITRTRDRMDRRVVHVGLTTEGTAMLKQATACIELNAEPILKAWGDSGDALASIQSRLVDLYPREAKIRQEMALA